MTIFPRPSQWARTAAGKASSASPVIRDHHYFAFLSYSHRDEAIARWLHEELEKFRVPSAFVGKLTDHGPVPRRLTPVFRDLKELPASNDLGTEIREAIGGARFLIVLCSPDSAVSQWTNAEIEAFKKVRPESCVLAAIVAGEPFASEMPGREHEECLPPALRHHYDRRGRRTGKRLEPLAADISGEGEARRVGFLKLVAGMLGIGLDDLVQREALRRHRRLGLIAAASLAGMVVTSGLAITAFQARNAADEHRRAAESLVGFMLGDLREKLEPLGRLDVLDSVGTRALAYYEEQNTSALSDESLLQRSKALTMMGEIATSRGDFSTALRLYREAFDGTGEALRRAPNDAQRMFDHAQNVFWIGYIDWQRGNAVRAEAAFRDYDRLAQRMVATEPSNTKWLLERTYANNTLGVLLFDQGRYRQAVGILGEALRISEGLAAIDPDDSAFQDRLLEALAWLADAKESSGSLEEALRLRQRQLAMIDRLKPSRPDDAELTRKAMTTHRVLGRLFASMGNSHSALRSLDTAAGYSNRMLLTEPENTEWGQFAAHTLLDRGELQLALGRSQAAEESAFAGCRIARRLAARDASVVEWRSVLPAKCLMQRARLALVRGMPLDAQALAGASVRIARREHARKDSAESRFVLAEAEFVRGEIDANTGKAGSAASAWKAAEAAWPRDVELDPRQMAIRAALLRRLGDSSASRQLSDQLATIGYRHPGYVRAQAGFPSI